jgi:ubiquinone biosynthesis protein COQ9
MSEQPGVHAASETGELPDLRRRLLAGMLRHAPFDGWTDKALAAAARAEGITPAMAAVAFQGGPAEAADLFNTEADRQMVEAVEAAIAKAAEAPVATYPSADAIAADAIGMAPVGARSVGLKIRERVTLAVRTRLVQHAAEREALRAMASFLAMPAQIGLASRCLWRTVDAMWRAVGDTSTDYNYYTKRALLAGVYGSTVLVWLDDSSEGFADTFAFLDRRIDDVMVIERGKTRLQQSLSALFHQVGAVWRGPARDYPHPEPAAGARRPPPSYTGPVT